MTRMSRTVQSQGRRGRRNAGSVCATAAALLLTLAVLGLTGTASAQTVGGPYFRDDCTTLTGAPTTSKILCWDQTAIKLKTWNGTVWTSVSGGGTVTHTVGALALNAFVLGNGGDDLKTLALTGLVKGNGTSAPTAYAGGSCTDPAYVQSIDLNGAVTCNTPVGAGTVTHTVGALVANAFVIGNGAADIKTLALTGLVKGNGASAPTAYAGTGPCAGGQFINQIDLNGVGTCGTPAGSGTVTHTVGALTANQLVLGNGGADVQTLGSLGSTTTVYHGNAAGAGTFGKVDLTADIANKLRNVDGGTGQDSSGWTGLALVAAGTWSAYTGTGPCAAGQFFSSMTASGVATCTSTGIGPFTTGRVPFATGAASLADDAGMFWNNTQKTLYLGVPDSPGEVAYPNIVRIINSAAPANLIGLTSQIRANRAVNDSGAIRGVGKVDGGAQNGMRALEGQVAKNAGAAWPMYGLEIGIGSKTAYTDPNHHVGIYVHSWNAFLDGAAGGVKVGTGVLVSDDVTGFGYGFRYLGIGGASEIFSVDSTGLLAVTSTTASGAGIVVTNTGINGSSIKLVGDGSNPGKWMRAHSGIFEVLNNLGNQTLLQVDELSIPTSTSLLLNLNGTMVRVSVGAADSCTAGFRCLRIVN